MQSLWWYHWNVLNKKELHKAFNESKYSKANFRGVSYKSKETPAKETPAKETPAKETPAKVTPAVNPDSMETESHGKPEQPVIKYTGGKLIEYEPDPNFEEGVSPDLAKELELLEKKLAS